MVGEPNLFSYVALFLWVPVTLVAFARLRAPLAAIVCVVGGVMFLPEQVEIDPPLLPPIDKGSMAAFWAFLGCVWKGRDRLRTAKPFRGIDLLFVAVLIGNVGTALTNGDPLVTGPVTRDGLVLYDALALGIKDTLGLYMPFLIGRAMLRTREDLDALLRVLVIGGVFYSLLALIEVRLSPQLHNWFYGFHQMSFSMTMRYGGYRPMVFMLTGMATAMFILSTAIAAAAQWRARAPGQSRRGAYLAAVGFLSLTLLLCKSTGAIVYGVVLLPVTLFVKKPKMWIATGLAVMVLLFPLLRGVDVFPTDTLVEWSESISEERALSLWFRFDQEDQLLERARERLLFGWGTYNRNRLFDAETGEDLSVTDGDWMLQLGTRGLVGFLGLYGLLAFAVVRAARRMKGIAARRTRILLAALAMISAIQTVDLLPNGLFHYLPFFFAGALEGLSASIVASDTRRKRRARAERAQAAREAHELERPRVIPRGHLG